MNTKDIKNNSYAIIKALYRGEKEFESIPLELIPNSDNMKLLMTLSEVGTSTSNMIKFPTSEKSFIVFSREQLNETFFEISIFEKNPTIKTVKKKITKSH